MIKRNITPQEIDILGPFIAELTGVVLDHSKAYLFETRLGPILDKYELENFTSLIQGIALNRNIECDTIDAITTQETLFFRDKHPFEFLQNKFLPDFFKRKGKDAPLNIWSAASSTGQEICSIAMTLHNSFCDMSKVRLTGTDISEDALNKARNGFYKQFEIDAMHGYVLLI